MTADSAANSDQELADGLAALGRGESGALGRVLPVVYARLRALARERMQHERPEHTLQPTALVHEALFRLGAGPLSLRDEGHFFAVAARAMREVLIDHARTHNREKRGGGRARVGVAGMDLPGPARELDVLELDDALARLARHDELGARIVELRFFAGMEVERIAEFLDITDRTVRRRWVYAKAWLLRQMSGASVATAQDPSEAPRE